MKQLRNKFLAVIVCLTMIVSVFSPVGQVHAAEDASGEYEIYPIPQQMEYAEGAWTLSEQANVIYETGIDDATKARLEETAALQEIAVAEGTALADGKTNILVGINGSGEFVDQYVSENYELTTEGLFDKTDAYFLASSEDTIVVLGKDTDAAFYGLTSLYHIFAQMEGAEIRSFEMEDWADVVSRGFIEGYYGNPWSLEDRCELMEWGGYYKLNSYFYAPKDDPKHNSNWRSLYTEEEIETLIKPLAEAGNASKCRFVFALHPYMYNALGTGSGGYEGDLAIMQAKFAQVIEAGVRQIAILADDAANYGSSAYITMLEDMTEWLQEMQKTYPDLKLTLPFCTQEYMNYGQSYYANFPENVQIVMTGGRVWGEVSDSFTTTFTNNVGRGPYLWINWPCTDNSKQHLIMGGYTTFLHPGVDPSKIQGIVLNPMQQSEPSKVAIFGNASYAWNIWTEEEANQAWEDSFKYVDHNSAIETEASEALRKLSHHMINQNMDSRVTALQESVEIKDTLNAFKASLDAGTVTAEDCDAIIAIFEDLQDAAEVYSESGNERIKSQIVYWLNCWADTTNAAISYLKAVKANINGDANTLISMYNEGMAAFAQSRTYGFHYVDHTEYAEVGVQHIVPFISALATYVEGCAELLLNPDAVLTTYITSRTDIPGSGNVDNITDGDEGTNAIYMNPNAIYAGEYVGLKFSKVIDIDDAKFVLGAGKDHFDSAKVQYTMDGVEWIDLNDTVYTGVRNEVQKIVLTEEELGADFQAMGIRLVATADNAADAWLEVREIAVNESLEEDDGTSIYDNVIKTSRWTVYSGSESSLFDGNDESYVWYDPNGGSGDAAEAGDYLGYDFGKTITINSIHAVVGNSGGDKFVSYDIQITTDGTNWETVKECTGVSSGKDTIDVELEGVAATGVRIVNKANQATWVKFSELTVEQAATADAKYLYTNVDTDILTTATENSVALTPGTVTLGTGEYVGVKLTNIKEIQAIDIPEVAEGLVVETSMNGEVWEMYTGDGTVDARYIRAINVTDKEVAWTIEGFTAYFYVVGEYSVESNFSIGDTSRDMRTAGDVAEVFDGNLSTYGEITGSQIADKEIVFDLGRNISFESLRYYIVETNMDYLRYAKFEVSADGNDWTEVLVVGESGFANTADTSTAKDASYLTHDSSNPGYMYAEVTGLGVEGRYLRVVPLETYDHRWVQFNEIQINGGAYVSPEDNKDIVSDATEVEYKIPSNALDGVLGTAYEPAAESGSFTYRLSETQNVKAIRIIQVGNVSNATVTAEYLNTEGTVEIGTLSQCLNEYNVPEDDMLLSVTVSWDGTAPSIAEIITLESKVEEKPVDPPVEPPVEEEEVIRISGKTRYETGFKVADHFQSKLGVELFEAVVIATGKNFADALAGSYLAVEKNAPILLTNGKDDNIAQLHEYIAANVMAGGKVYILGGEGAVPAAVEAIDGYDVVRLSGKSRYETNIAILNEAGIAGDEIIVATGKAFADSLSASAAKLPILLVKPGEALSAEAKAIAEGMSKFYIIGGEGAVSADIAAELAAYGEVVRVSGKTRYETSVAVANTFFADVEEAVVANGKNFPDGLCGGPLAAAMNAPLILTADAKTDAAADYMAEMSVASGFVLGGTGALADESVVDVFALGNADEIILK